ncbi:MAG: EamA family transporter, partial [Clostridia bacterium]|nr:EamA family transporter [Clostridia bacterium]
LFMIVVGLLFGGNIEVTSYKAVGVLMYLAFLSAIAYALWGVLLKYNPVSKVSIFNFMTPVFGVILSEIMLTEASKVKPVNVVVTLVLISIGIFMLNHKNEKEKI